MAAWFLFRGLRVSRTYNSTCHLCTVPRHSPSNLKSTTPNTISPQKPKKPKTLNLKGSDGTIEGTVLGSLKVSFEGSSKGLGFFYLGAEYPSQKKVNLSIMVGLYRPKRLKVTYSATRFRLLL